MFRGGGGDHFNNDRTARLRCSAKKTRLCAPASSATSSKSPTASPTWGNDLTAGAALEQAVAVEQDTQFLGPAGKRRVVALDARKAVCFTEKDFFADQLQHVVRAVGPLGCAASTSSTRGFAPVCQPNVRAWRKRATSPLAPYTGRVAGE